MVNGVECTSEPDLPIMAVAPNTEIFLSARPVIFNTLASFTYHLVSGFKYNCSCSHQAKF